MSATSRRGTFPGHTRFVESAATDATAAAPPSEPGWVSYANWKADGDGGIHSLSGRWTVPEAPGQEIEQTLFVHLGLQSETDPVVILSASVQWGPSAAGGGDYWALSCFIAEGSTVAASPIVRVSPGDAVEAEIRRFIQMDVPVWECRVSSGERETQLRAAFTADAPSMSLAYGGVLEAYCDQTMDCPDYPASELTPFTGLSLTGAGGTALEPAWTATVAVEGCGRRVEIPSAQAVSLYYR